MKLFAGRRIGAFEVFLVILIFLNIADFFEFIGDEFDYIKKIISWTLLGVLLYRASPSKIFFGNKNSSLDGLLITMWFLLIIKNLVAYVANAMTQTQSFLSIAFFDFIITQLGNDKIVITIAMCGLIALAIYSAITIPFHKRSVMGVLHEEGEPSRKMFFSRFVMSFIVFAGFFLYVFNMIMEWLAIAVDATITVIALAFYIGLLLLHKINGKGLLYKVGEIGGSFYAYFLEHFRYKQSFLLGIAGLLVLHSLTDIGIFLVPFIIGISDILYFKRFDPSTHQNVWSVLSSDLASSVASPALIFLFVANIIGIFFLFLSPGIIWYLMYKNRKVHIPKKLLVLFYTTLPAIILSPLFSISRLNISGYAGVDIQTRSMLTSFSPYVIVACGVILGIISFILSKNAFTSKLLQKMWVAITLIFFGAYTWFYFLDIASYYQDLVKAFIQHGLFFLAGVFFLFQALTIIFYLGSFGLFIWEIGKHHRSTHSFDVTSNEFKPII